AQPASASVTLLGPASMLESLKPEEVKIVVDGTTGPRIELPPALNGRVSLKSIQPSRFIIP
ncbi:MAG TPA: hypothetical protein VIK76_16765, partial [Pyrinomonadaceae bacterium]